MILGHVAIVAQLGEVRWVDLKALKARRCLRAVGVFFVIVIEREGRRRRYGDNRGWRSGFGGILASISILTERLYIVLTLGQLIVKASPIDIDEGSSGVVITKLTIRVDRDIVEVKRRVSLGVIGR